MRKLIPLICLVCLLISTMDSSSQCLLIEVPLEEQIQQCEKIVEGEVVKKDTYYSGSNIFTSYRIKVFKTFKGSQEEDFIEIIKPGGRIDDLLQVVNPSVDLHVGQVGTFMLNSLKRKIVKDGESELPQYKGALYQQSIYLYDNKFKSVSGVFRKFEDRATDWYSFLKNSLKSNVLVHAKLDDKTESDSRSISASISSVSPTDVKAGYLETIHIYGSGFGNSRGSSTVSFRNSNYASQIFYIECDPTQYMSWSDTHIEVVVPSFAGSGAIRVTVDNADSFSEDITVRFNLRAIVFNENNYRAELKGIQNSNGIHFNMHTNVIAEEDSHFAFLKSMTTWRNEVGIDWSVKGVTSNSSFSKDDENTFFWENFGAGALGATQTFYKYCSFGYIWADEIDIKMNSHYQWSYGSSINSNEFDFESVMVHELGHALQSLHILEDGYVMFPSIGAGEVNRIPHPDEFQAINELKTFSQSSNTSLCSSTNQIGDDQNIIYCDKHTTGESFGHSWAHPHKSLQDALNLADDNDQIHLARGTYFADQGYFVNEGDQEASFTLEGEKGILGSFDSQIGERNLKQKSILSGNINQLDLKNDNTRLILEGNSTGAVDGVIIEDGNSEYTNNYGIGARVTKGEFKNVIFRNNTVEGSLSRGGGVYINNTDNPNDSIIFKNCLFYGNHAHKGGGLHFRGSNLKIESCTFSNNGGSSGCGINIEYGSGSLNNSIVYGNESANDYSTLNSNIYVSNSLVGNLSGFEGDPKFIGDEAFDFRLDQNSIAYNTGVEDDLGIDNDVLGYDRYNGQIDKGAIEFNALESSSRIPLDIPSLYSYDCPSFSQFVIPESQQGTTYWLLDQNDEIYSDPVEGNGAEIYINPFFQFDQDVVLKVAAQRESYKSLKFLGETDSSYIELVGSDTLTFSGDESFSGFFKFKLEDVSNFKRLVEHYGNWGFGINQQSLVFTKLGIADYTAVNYVLYPGINYEASFEYKVYGDDAVVKIYLNGALIYSTLTGTNMYLDQAKITIGGGINNDIFKGEIDYLQINKGQDVLVRYNFNEGSNDGAIRDQKMRYDASIPLYDGVFVDPSFEWIAGEDETYALAPTTKNITIDILKDNGISYVENGTDGGIGSLNYEVENACSNGYIYFRPWVTECDIFESIQVNGDVNIIGNGFNATKIYTYVNPLFEVQEDVIFNLEELKFIKTNNSKIFNASYETSLKNIHFTHFNPSGSNIPHFGLSSDRSIRVSGEVKVY